MSIEDDPNNTIAWLKEERSLIELSERFPEAWEAAKIEIIGNIRLNVINKFLVKKLFFSKAGQKKPVSLLWFRILWPCLWQRSSLMLLVQFEGIYCFYSQNLIQELFKLIGVKSCLEIAAGDGTLSRFLKAQGTQITATDNRSWNFSINYPDMVLNCDAEEALQTYNSEVVLCAWPPKNNDFEKHIFQTNCVQLYILIASHKESASGNWASYREQTTFTFTEAVKLSKMILPPELDAAVYVFERIKTPSVE